MARIALAWELGGGSGHVAALVAAGNALQDAGHTVQLHLRDMSAGSDLPGAARLPRAPAPVWAGPQVHAAPRNYAEILTNFGYASTDALRPLLSAWRERVKNVDLLVCNTAPAGHLAARLLGIPSLEISQGYNVPPAAFPSPPLADWGAAPVAELAAADRCVLEVINSVLRASRVSELATIGELIEPRAFLLTYPELDVYGPRTGGEYLGVLEAPAAGVRAKWPPGAPRVFLFLPPDHPQLTRLVNALDEWGWPAAGYLRGGASIEAVPSNVNFSSQPLDVARALSESHLVVSHAGHTFAAQTLLAGRPALLLPMHLEQFLTMRRVVRMGAGLGVEPGVAEPDLIGALKMLAASPSYGRQAAAFSERYAQHDRRTALKTFLARCEHAMRRASNDH
jgi:UDP:flavonoid glycosyltransferase YjiC (YdhE family)